VRSRGDDDERRSHAALDGGYFGTAVGFSVYVIAILSAILG